MTASEVGRTATGTSRSLSPLEDCQLKFMKAGWFIWASLRLGDPSKLRGEALDVILLLLERLGRQEHGEVGLINTHLLDVSLEPFSDLVPDVHGKRSENEETRNLGVVLDHLGLEYHLLVPLGEVLGLGHCNSNDLVRLLSTDDRKVGLLSSLGSLLSSKTSLLLGLLQGALGLFGGALHFGEIRVLVARKLTV